MTAAPQFRKASRDEVLAALADPAPSPLANEVARLIEGYVDNWTRHVEQLGRIPASWLTPKGGCAVESVAIELATKAIKDAIS